MPPPYRPYRLPEMSPWKRQALTIPPDSWNAWMRLATWEIWIGVLLYGALSTGTHLIVSAPGNIVTVFDFSNCYGVPPIPQPCERVAYKAGLLNVLLNSWCGLLLVSVGIWLMWELWIAVAPKPITDDFLKLLDDSFGRDWRRPRTWPWARMIWAYGFTLVGATSALGMGLLLSAMLSSSIPFKPPAVHVETTQHFRPVQ
jgi:hypothetical protein